MQSTMSELMENSHEHDEDLEQGNEQVLQEEDNDEDWDATGGDKKWPGWPGDSVFRILVPSQKVGGLIGRKGEFIKKTCEESRSRIKILDGPPGAPERTVMISAKEEPHASLPPAMDGLLRVHKRIIDGLDGGESAQTSGTGGHVSTRLLVSSSQAGSLIGKHGAVIRSIQEASKSVVRIVEDLPVFALQDDRVVEIVGEPPAVHKALELIAGHLRKFLVDHSVLPLFETRAPLPSAHMEQDLLGSKSWGRTRGLSPHVSGPGYGGNPPPFTPGIQGSFLPLSDLHTLDEHPPHHGVSAYGREMLSVSGLHTSANIQSQQPMMSQVTEHMQIPLSYADAVIGISGSSISYIRRASGATITIQETTGVPGEMTVEINGSASQVQTAQQLIQNFMAEAMGSAHNAASNQDQSYNSYHSQGSTYGSPPPSNTGHGGGFGSVYGDHYEY
ncbi:unnamed protein product [Spirodela intermedia]|uniref:K Homology domain-containing protein n=1 Tax=Spirodela intermedia TaxID=51605 RepID=A0A7I8L2S3_SPIIN|nr:unnamed protein product [Spirodela intermedia]